MSYELDGKLHKKFETENKTASFQAREFVVEITSGNYPQFIKFQLTQDRCALIDDMEEGHDIKVHFDLRGREWNGKYFTNLNAWRVEKPTVNQGAPVNNMPEPESGGSFPSAADDPGESANDSFNDQLPF
jgi:hypothetical protein